MTNYRTVSGNDWVGSHQGKLFRAQAAEFWETQWTDGGRGYRRGNQMLRPARGFESFANGRFPFKPAPETAKNGPSRELFCRSFYAEVLPGRALKVAAC
jgi:hypothetical protein